MKNSQQGYTAWQLLSVLVWFTFAIGWALNIIAVVGSLDAGLTGLFVLRIVGIFVAPLGSVLGFFF